MTKTTAQIEASAFAEAKRLATQKETKPQGVERMIALAFGAVTPGIRAWAKQFLETTFNLKIGMSDATEGTTGSVSRQVH